MNWLGYAKSGAEQDTRDELRASEIEAHAPVKLVLERRGKDRRPRAYVEPVIPRLLFIRGTANDFHRLHDVRTLSRTLMSFPDAAWNAYVAPFLARCVAEYDATQARIKAGEMLDEYKRGDRLMLKNGPFADQVASFLRVVERAHDMHPMLVAEMEVFGGVREIEVDPLAVKRA